jgi:hypothetical protein
MKSRTKYVLVAVFALLLVVVGQTAGPLTVTASAADVIAVQSFGASYGEWSARWWQWLLSIPAATNPNLGGDPTQGQVDDVWFLPGTFGDTVVYTINIPAGKPIFFPIINSIAFKPFGYETLLDLRKLAARFPDSVTDLEVTIDGKDIPDLFNFRVRSPSFTVIAPPKGLLPPGNLKAPGNTDPIVSDGYWLLLSPLPVGSHEIHVLVKTNNGFEADTTYKLTIGP